MLVDEIMTPMVRQIDIDEPVARACEMMRYCNIGWLPVTDETRVYGVVTDRDIVTRILADGLDPRETPVRGAATPAAVSCDAIATDRQAAKLMEEKHVRRLLVADAEGKPAGVLSMGDLATRAHRRDLAAKVLAATHRDGGSGAHHDEPAT
jgi:CBS domain-containing protein